MIIINDIKYNGRSAVKQAERNGISRNVFANRIRNGWSVRRACTYKKGPNLKEVAYKLGISYRKLYYLITCKGWTCEELLKKKEKENGNSICL